jgi:rRNA-processing protein FCF1
MELFQLIILLALLAETTYLTVKAPKISVSKKQGRPVFIDTSVLIDGRIVPVAKSGFLSGTIIIPRSVVGELQFLADNADHEKRARARRGLDIVSELQNMPQIEVEILQDGSKAAEGVDERLLKLAKQHGGAICTIDYNLNKVAVVEGVTVLNVNELAQTLRMAYLPGERMLLEIVQKGQDAHQGVGYLPDGTMVVVENSSSRLGQSVEVEFIRSLQTAAGRMMFARLAGGDAATKQPQPYAKKASGKKPIEASEKTVLQPPAAPHSSQQVSSPAEPRKAYHAQPRKNAAGSNPRRQSNTRNTRPQPPSSADREASLLDLVGKQDNK